MRKVIYSILAVLLITGVCVAANIPQSENPKEGPAVWTIPVYSAGALDVGDVVVWAIGDSTGDDDNWVATTTTADTQIVAGVVYPTAIAAGDTGTIAIRGVVQVDWVTSGAGVQGTAGALACTSTTAGSAHDCTTGTGDAASFGYVVQTASSGSALVFIK